MQPVILHDVRGMRCCAGEPLHTDGLGSLEEGEPLLPQQPKQTKSKRYTNEILYGIINAIVGAPTMISFAAIVYQVLAAAAISSYAVLRPTAFAPAMIMP